MAKTQAEWNQATDPVLLEIERLTGIPATAPADYDPKKDPVLAELDRLEQEEKKRQRPAEVPAPKGPPVGIPQEDLARNYVLSRFGVGIPENEIVPEPFIPTKIERIAGNAPVPAVGLPLRRVSPDEPMTPLPPTAGEFAETIFKRTVPGLALQAAGVIGPEPESAKAFGTGGDLAVTVASFVADPTTYLSFGLGGAVAKGAGKALTSPVTRGVVKGAVGLGAFEGARSIPTQILERGEVGIPELARDIGTGIVLGGVTGGISPLGEVGVTLPQRVAAKTGATAAEIAAFGVGSPLLEARKPTQDDFQGAAGVILGLKATNIVGGALYKLARGMRPTPEETRALATVPPEQRAQIAQTAGNARAEALATPSLREPEGKPSGMPMAPRLGELTPEKIRPLAEAQLAQYRPGPGDYKATPDEVAGVVSRALTGSREGPDVQFVLGPIAAGKTSAVERAAKNSNITKILPDEFKRGFEGYRDADSRRYHAASSAATEVAREIAIENGIQFLNSGTGDAPATYRAMVDRIAARGKNIRGQYLYVPLSESVRRNVARAAGGGREALSEGTIAQKYRSGIQTAFEVFATNQKVESFQLLSNRANLEGKPIANFVKGRLWGEPKDWDSFVEVVGEWHNARGEEFTLGRFREDLKRFGWKGGVPKDVGGRLFDAAGRAVAPQGVSGSVSGIQRRGPSGGEELEPRRGNVEAAPLQPEVPRPAGPERPGGAEGVPPEPRPGAPGARPGGEPTEAVRLEPPPPATPENIARAREHVSRHIEVSSRGWKNLKEAYQNFDLQSFTARMYTKLFRSIYPIEQAGIRLGGEKGFAPGADPGIAAALAAGSANRAEMFLKSGPFQILEDGNLKPTGTPSLEKTLAPFRGNLGELREYLTAARAVEIAEKGKKTGLDAKYTQLVVQQAPESMKHAGRDIVEFQNQVARYAKEAGLLSEAGYQAMLEEGKRYVPFRRVFESEGFLAGGRAGIQGFSSPFKKLEGSTRRIHDPLESIVERTRRVIVAADRARIGKLLADAAEANPQAATGLMERVETKGAPAFDAKARALKAELAEAGVALDDAVAAELSQIFQGNILDKKANQIRVWRNGKQETWRIHPDLATAFEAMNPADTDLLIRLLGFPAQTLKAGVTLNPIFSVFNLIRDTFDATLQSKYGFRPGIDTVKGFWESLKKEGKTRQEFLAAGGGFSTFRGSDPKSVAKMLRSISEPAPVRRLRTFTNPLEILRALSRPFEEASRLGEYMRAREAGASAIESALAANRVTVDFAQMGAAMRGWSYVTAFMNPAVQSMDTFARTLGRNPTGMLAKGIAAISIPSLYFWIHNQGDQDLEDLRKTNGGLIYWFFRLPSGEIVKVPKPFLYGQIFGTGMETALDALDAKDPEAMTRLILGLKEQVTANFIPTAGQAYIAQLANRRTFFDSPIVPPDLAELEPQFQYTDKTGTVARKIGAATNISPLRIEELVRNVGGTLGGNALDLLDRTVDSLFSAGRPSRPERTNADMPLIGRVFARYPSSGVEPLQTFYRDSERVRKTLNTFERLLEREPELAQEYATRHPLELSLAPVYETVRQVMREIRDQIELVERAPDDLMTPRAKRIEIDKLTRQMIEAARTLNLDVQKLILAPEPQEAVQVK